MIRIMTADEPASIVITVDGTLSNGSVEQVQGCCMEALSNGKPVRLFLRDVRAIDEAGRKMLQGLAAEGINLTAKGIYSSYIVDGIQSAALSSGESRDRSGREFRLDSRS